MRSVLCVLLLSGFFCFGQAPGGDQAVIGKLGATLTALGDPGLDRSALSRHLVDEMMSLADARVSRPTVERFVDPFIGALIGHPLTHDQVASLQSCITHMLRGSMTNSRSSQDLREVLTSLHIDSLKTRVITRSFLAVGEEVRGPDDSPVAGNGK